MRKIIFFSLFFIFVSFSFLPTLVSAQTQGQGTGNGGILNIWRGTGPARTNPGADLFCIDRGYTCNFCDGMVVVTNVIELLLDAAIALAILIILYGAIRMMTSGGSREQLSNAKGIILKALLGLALVAGAWLIVDTIYKTFVNTGQEGWNDIEFLGCPESDFKAQEGVEQENNNGNNNGNQGNSGGQDLPEGGQFVDRGTCPIGRPSIGDPLGKDTNGFFQTAQAAGGKTLGGYVVEWAESYKGKLIYSNDADKRRNLTAGYGDCSGLVSEIYKCTEENGTLKIPDGTANLASFRGNEYLEKWDIKNITLQELSNIKPGDLVGFDSNCRNDWHEERYNRTGQTEIAPSSNCTGRTVARPYCYGHVMIFSGLSGYDPLILHQTDPGNNTKGVYEEAAPEKYRDPFKKCGFVIHIKDQRIYN